MKAKKLLPWLAIPIGLCAWSAICQVTGVPDSVFPGPQSVGLAFMEEFESGRMQSDLLASIFRVTTGFCLGVLAGIPFGLLLGSFEKIRALMLGSVNFFRSLSSVAWMPFAILWFGIGDPPVIFLIFIATFFPIVLATTAACTTIPQTYFQVASEYGIFGFRKLWRIVFPAILPQLITALRMACGIAWVTVVAAEMLAGKGGLGFAIQDARNGLRTDVLMVEMILIGTIGVILDRLILMLMRHKSVRWGYEN